MESAHKKNKIVTFSISYLLLLFILGILFPINGVLSGKRIKEFLSTNPQGKMIFYRQTIIIQFVLATLVFAAMAFNRDSLDEIGLSFFRQPLLVLGLLAICFLGWWLLWNYRFAPRRLRRSIERDAAVKFLFPTTKQEYHWSIGVSFAAGISEEIVFRGFLYWQLAQFLPIIPSIILANLVFGLCHYGTGPKNAFLAFSLGVLLSILFLYTDSLFFLMIIHVLVDIYSMTKGKRYFDLNAEENIILD